MLVTRLRTNPQRKGRNVWFNNDQDPVHEDTKGISLPKLAKINRIKLKPFSEGLRFDGLPALLGGLCNRILLQAYNASLDLGCAFHQNSTRFRWNLAKRHWQEQNVKVRSTGMRNNTILVIPVHSGWYLSTRFLQVEKARTYSK